jgi:muconolactone delta-isomerase
MQFITISERNPGFTDEAFAALRDEESRRARTLYMDGYLRRVWHRDDVPGACLLWEADSEEHVKAILATLPFVRGGLISIIVIPLRPYAGFGP